MAKHSKKNTAHSKQQGAISIQKVKWSSEAQAPYLDISSQSLERAGFSIDDVITIKFEKGKITISREDKAEDI